jgi:hydroxymethylpyrimidine/phosphomethylpyrimidine kinase
MTPNVLTIAGFDPSGGAGVLADIKTFAALRCYGVAAVTALTAQNTQGVQALRPVQPDLLAAQIDSIFNDIEIAAVKIGMLATPENVRLVARKLSDYRPRHIVLDPVMRASSGDPLAAGDVRAAILQELAPYVTLVTPNLNEAAELAGGGVPTSATEMADIGTKLLNAGFKAVLVTGGHLPGADAVDVLVGDGTGNFFSSPRVATNNAHGTGCTLSSAIAAGLAHGLALPASIEAAKAYVTQSLATAGRLKVGEGAGPLHHLGHLW